MERHRVEWSSDAARRRGKSAGRDGGLRKRRAVQSASNQEHEDSDKDEVVMEQEQDSYRRVYGIWHREKDEKEDNKEEEKFIWRSRTLPCTILSRSQGST